MARRVTWGTPSRTLHYLFPRPAYALFFVSLALGVFLLFALGVFQVAGVRAPLSPGDVTSAHAAYDSRCEACHASGQGASNLRCQRCHDTGGMGRLTQAAHVLFGSGDPGKADATRNLACARCHVEHRGSRARLSAVDEAQCARCHAAWRPASAGLAYRIAVFSAHPEFKVLREGLQVDPRMLFSHQRHMREMIKEGAPGEWESCTSCHVPERGQGRDLEPIQYQPHCARCHSESELTMLPVPAQDVVEDVGIREAAGGFQRIGDTIQKPVLRHKDEWVLHNLRRLQWELYPDVYTRDRGALEGRLSQLERRVVQAEPLAGLGLDALRDREAAVLEEIRRLELRTREPEAAADVLAGLARLLEVQFAARAAADPSAVSAADALRARSRALEASGARAAALPRQEFEERRRELLSILDLLSAADPQRRRTVDDLRRRVLALAPGEAGAENLARALRQRRDDLSRARDEVALRAAGVSAEVRSLPERVALQQELRETRERLERYYSFRGAPPELSPEDRARKEQALRNLTGEGTKERCAQCHLFERGSLAPVRPARPVLVRAAFAHRKHLIAPLPPLGLWRRLLALVPGRSEQPSPEQEVQRRFRCAYCHTGIVKAGDAPRLPSVPPVSSCRECHRVGASRADCQLCHRYHPPGGPA